MDRGAAVLLTALVGGAVALQAPINSGLGRSIGTFQAAAVSFTIGTVVLAAIAGFAGRGYGGLAGLRDIAPYYLLGGVLGAMYVTTVLVTVRTLGAGGLTAATISGQLAMSVAIDHFGLLGVDRQPVSVTRVLGLLLLAGGTWLIIRD